MKTFGQWPVTVSVALAATLGPLAQSASAATAAELNASGRAALSRLYAQSDRAVRYGRDAARDPACFREIVKAGFLIGGQGGEGVLFMRGQPVRRITKSAPFPDGLQAGGQSFSYALFLMNDKALNYLRKSDGCGNRLWAKRGRDRQGQGHEHHLNDACEGRLRHAPWAKGADGGHRPRRIEDLSDR